MEVKVCVDPHVAKRISQELSTIRKMAEKCVSCNSSLVDKILNLQVYFEQLFDIVKAKKGVSDGLHAKLGSEQ